MPALAAHIFTPEKKQQQPVNGQIKGNIMLKAAWSWLIAYYIYLGVQFVKALSGVLYELKKKKNLEVWPVNLGT